MLLCRCRSLYAVVEVYLKYYFDQVLSGVQADQVIICTVYDLKLIRGLKRVARFSAPKYSRLIIIFLIPYLVTRSSIQNGRLTTKQTYPKISLRLSRF